MIFSFSIPNEKLSQNERLRTLEIGKINDKQKGKKR